MTARSSTVWLAWPRGAWPRGLGGRTILVLLLAVVIVHLGTVLLYRENELGRTDADLVDKVAGRLAIAAGAVAAVPLDGRDARAHELSTPDLDLHWGDHATTLAHLARSSTLPGFRRQLSALAPRLGPVALQFGSAGAIDDPSTLAGSVALPDGGFLNFTSALLIADPPWTYRSTLMSTVLMAAGVTLVAAALVRSLTRPLRRLATAADGFGRGPDVRVPETGPLEVRQVARAFNGMTRRIEGLIDDRTQSLAAVSHDLRTPITRLRLRAGFLTDADVQAAFDADLDEMEAMIEATLAYLRGDVETEPREMTDLAVLLSTLVDDTSDAGHDATYEGPDHAPAALHASSVRRAFANLVANAVAHGGSVRVALERAAEGFRVHVDDRGPGIPVAERVRVFQPFYRLDGSRGGGGVGLGLTIAQRAVANEGGSIALNDRAEGGLRVTVELPIDRGEVEHH